MLLAYCLLSLPAALAIAPAVARNYGRAAPTVISVPALPTQTCACQNAACTGMTPYELCVCGQSNRYNCYKTCGGPEPTFTNCPGSPVPTSVVAKQTAAPAISCTNIAGTDRACPSSYQCQPLAGIRCSDPSNCPGTCIPTGVASTSCNAQTTGANKGCAPNKECWSPYPASCEKNDKGECIGVCWPILCDANSAVTSGSIKSCSKIVETCRPISLCPTGGICTGTCQLRLNAARAPEPTGFMWLD